MRLDYYGISRQVIPLLCVNDRTIFPWGNWCEALFLDLYVGLAVHKSSSTVYTFLVCRKGLKLYPLILQEARLVSRCPIQRESR